MESPIDEHYHDLPGLPAVTEAVNLYRRLSAALLDEAWKRSGLTLNEAVERLQGMLGRDTLSRQSMLNWRRGDQPVPGEVLFAMTSLAGVASGRIVMVAELFVTVATRDPDLADAFPGGREWIADYVRERFGIH